jgi:WD40 repeat protein
MVIIWDFETGQFTTLTPEGPSYVTSMAWSPDGNYLASAHDTNIKIWRVGTWQLIDTIPGLTSRGIRSLSWSPGSRYLAGVEGSCCTAGTIRIWEVESRRVIRSFEQDDQVMSAMWSPDGRYIASGSLDPRRGVRIWESATGNLLRTFLAHGEKITSVRWSPDGRYVVSSSEDRTIRVLGERREE